MVISLSCLATLSLSLLLDLFDFSFDVLRAFNTFNFGSPPPPQLMINFYVRSILFVVVVSKQASDSRARSQFSSSYNSGVCGEKESPERSL